MPVKKLTGVAIQGAKPNDDGSRAWYWDSAHKGLCLRVGNRDKSWLYYYRFDGKQRNQTLGKYAPNRFDHMDRDAAIDAADRKWQQDIQETEIQLMSSLDARTMLPSYRDIIDLGLEALPLVFERLREGYYDLNKAITEITGVNLREEHSNDIGEQRLSELWIEWWEQRR